VRYLWIVGVILLSGCAIEPDSWYCQQNGYTPGTDMYLQCLDSHAETRLAASANLLYRSQQEMQVQYVPPPQVGWNGQQ
jgi:hypothetical protein